MEIQGYCDKETQYRNTSVIHHASDLTFEPIDLDVEPRLHQFNFKNNLFSSSSDKSLLLISTLSRNDVSTG
jgi:hypothetical protein